MQTKEQEQAQRELDLAVELSQKRLALAVEIAEVDKQLNELSARLERMG